MRDRLSRLAQDRLIWFVILGLLLFGADRLMQSRDNNVIKIDLPLVEKLVAQWEGQTERRPNARELDALIEGHIREEIWCARRRGSALMMMILSFVADWLKKSSS